MRQRKLFKTHAIDLRIGPPTATGCREWIGHIDFHGYGRFGPYLLAHRAIWQRERGPIPDGLFVCHHCDNRICVNIDHLFLGTHADNMRDAKVKGRLSGARNAGVLNRRAKLTEDQVREIRRSSEPVRVQAARHGVAQSTIVHVRLRHSWRHLSDAP